MAVAGREGRGVSVARDRWLLGWRGAAGARTRLFCFPFAGGGASAFHPWRVAAPEGIDVAAVQFPGRETRLREEAFRRTEALAEAVAEGVEPRLDVPFAFFGHSMGALVAYEVVRVLRRRGGPLPFLLVVSGKNGPRAPRIHPPLFELSDEDLLDEVRHYYEPSNEAYDHPELRDLLMPVLRADIEICDTYVFRPEAPLDIPIVAFGGEEDRGSSAEGIAAWKSETTASFRMSMFPGGHFYLNEMLPSIQAMVWKEIDRWRPETK